MGLYCLYMGRCKSNERVVAYHLDGRLFRIYESARKAALNRHAHPRTIDKCIRGDTLTAFGYMWRRYPVDSIPEQIEPFQKPTSTFAPVPIAEIDENGNVIRYFESIKKAGKELGIDPHSIMDNLRGKSRQTNGHMFRYLNSEELNNQNIPKSKRYISGPKTVIQLTLDGKYIKQFPSIKNAAESLGKKTQGIQQVLNGKYKTAYGYKWRYKK